MGRPSKAEPFRPLVERLLTQDQDVLTIEVLRRARLAGYRGGKSAIFALVAKIRPPKSAPTIRFEGLPGEFTQHDFGEVDVRFLDGSTRHVHFFASRLKYSRFVQVSLVPDQKVESLLRPLVDHFAAMGGIPLLAVFDRPKTVALRWKKGGEVVEWNPTFGSAALELGLGVEVCWPRRPNQKGSVESLVKWVKGSFFKQRRFLDMADLKQQLEEWHLEVNTRTPSRATGVIPSERLLEEQARLRPLRVVPRDFALRLPIFVGPTGYVLHDTHLYSMPEAVGLPGTLYLYRDCVRIVAGRFEAVHARLFEPHAKSTLAEHRLPMVASACGVRGKRYLKRQHLLDLGPAAFEYLTEITHRRPREWVCEVDRLHDLLQRWGDQRLRRAFEQCVEGDTYGTEYVLHHLKAQHTAQREVQ